MPRNPNHAPGCPCCFPVTVEAATTRFRALASPDSHLITAMPVLHDALGLPVDVGDEVRWSVLQREADGGTEWRGGQVMARAQDALQVKSWETERVMWLKPGRVIAVTRLLRGGER